MTLLRTNPAAGGCGCCDGSLPYTITISFSKLDDGSYYFDLAGLMFSSCYGGGATGRYIATNKIEQVTLGGGGKCYAKLGRAEPELTASVAPYAGYGPPEGTPSGGTFNITLGEHQEVLYTARYSDIDSSREFVVCDKLDYWSVAEIEASGGSGYKNQRVTVNPGPRDTAQNSLAVFRPETPLYATMVPADAPLVGGITITKNGEPSLAASATCGSGASFTVSLTASGSDPGKLWGVSGVTVTDGGSGYNDLDRLSFSLGFNDIEKKAAEVAINVANGVIQSTTVISAGEYYKSGILTGVKLDGYESGAPQEPAANEYIYYGGVYYRESYEAEAYAPNVVVTASRFDFGSGPACSITATTTPGFCVAITPVVEPHPDGGGWQRIGSATISGLKYYVKDNDPVAFTFDEFCIVDTQPVAHITKAAPSVYSVVVTNKGKFKPDTSSMSVKATVDTDPSSATFGEITDITLESSGTSGYWTTSSLRCASWVNDSLSVVLRAVDPKPLIRVIPEATFGSGACVSVVTNPRVAPTFKSACQEPTLKYEGGDTSLPYWWLPNSCAAEVTGCALNKIAIDGGYGYYCNPEWDGQPTGIKQVAVTSKGSGYALLGRVEPTIKANPEGWSTSSSNTVPDWWKTSSPGTVTLTTSKEQDDLEHDYWYVSDASAAGGDGYAEFPIRLRPNISATTETGSGASFSATLSQQPTTSGKNYYWRVESIAVSDPCKAAKDYIDGQEMVIQVGERGVTQERAIATLTAVDGVPTGVVVSDKGKYWRMTNERVAGWIRVKVDAAPGDTTVEDAVVWLQVRGEPVLTATVEPTPGDNAAFFVQMERVENSEVMWRVISVYVMQGGSEYSGRIAMRFDAGETGRFSEEAVAFAIAGESGSIESVEVVSGGAYWAEPGDLHGAKVVKGGHYYREDKTKTPYVAELTTRIEQSEPSQGSGAAVTLAIETNTQSADFGKIKSATVNTKGDGYSLLGGPKSCAYSSAATIPWSAGSAPLAAIFHGDGYYSVSLAGGPGGSYRKHFIGDDAPKDCSKSFTLTAKNSVSSRDGEVTITSGGTWTQCPAEIKAPQEYYDCLNPPCSLVCGDYATVKFSGVHECTDGKPFVVPLGLSKDGCTLAGDITLRCFSNNLAGCDRAQISVSLLLDPKSQACVRQQVGLSLFAVAPGSPAAGCAGGQHSFLSATPVLKCEDIGFSAASLQNESVSMTMTLAGSSATTSEEPTCPTTMTIDEYVDQNGGTWVPGFGSGTCGQAYSYDEGSLSVFFTLDATGMPPVTTCSTYAYRTISIAVTKSCRNCGKFSASLSYSDVDPYFNLIEPTWVAGPISSESWPSFGDFNWTLESCYATWCEPQEQLIGLITVKVNLVNTSQEDEALIQNALANGWLQERPQCLALPQLSWTIE